MDLLRKIQTLILQAYHPLLEQISDDGMPEAEFISKLYELEYDKKSLIHDDLIAGEEPSYSIRLDVKKEVYKILQSLELNYIIICDDRQKRYFLTDDIKVLLRSLNPDENIQDEEDLFKEQFSTILSQVTQDDVDYLNEVLVKTTDTNEDFIPLSVDTLQEINYIVYILHNLKSKGITTGNYYRKMDTFNKFVNTALDEYGIYISESFPYDNPTELLSKIDILLREHKFSNEQKLQFYKELAILKRSPDEKDVQEALSVEDRIMNDYYSLPEAERDKIDECDDIKAFNQETIELIRKYGYRIPDKKTQEGWEWKDMPYKKVLTLPIEKQEHIFSAYQFSIFLDTIYTFTSERQYHLKERLDFEEGYREGKRKKQQIMLYKYDNFKKKLPKLLSSKRLFK